jgi:hypothetical protein
MFLRQIDTEFFREIDSEMKAYTLGLLAADGSIGRQVVLELQSGDEAVLQAISSAMRSDYPLTRKRVYGRKVGGSLTTRLWFRSAPFMADFERLGLAPLKRDRTRFPAVPEPLRRHMFRGYVDGDGSITKMVTHWAVDTCFPTREMAEEFAEWARAITGSRASVRQSRKRMCSFQIGGPHKFMALSKALYLDASVYMERRMRKVQLAWSEYAADYDATGAYIGLPIKEIKRMTRERVAAERQVPAGP